MFDFIWVWEDGKEVEDSNLFFNIEIEKENLTLSLDEYFSGTGSFEFYIRADSLDHLDYWRQRVIFNVNPDLKPEFE